MMQADIERLIALKRWRLLPNEPWMQRSIHGEWVQYDELSALLTLEPSAPEFGPPRERDRVCRCRYAMFRQPLLTQFVCTHCGNVELEDKRTASAKVEPGGAEPPQDARAVLADLKRNCPQSSHVAADRSLCIDGECIHCRAAALIQKLLASGAGATQEKK